MSELHVPDPTERADLGAFTARVVRLDATAPIRLRGSGDRVTAWALTPFDTLATRSARGAVAPPEVTVVASVLLTGLTVDRSERVDLGAGTGPWAAELPPDDGWQVVDDIPATEVEALTERGLAVARESAGPLGPPASLLDQTVLTVQADGPGADLTVRVPMRCLFALSGMGFAGDAAGSVRVSATGSWLRLDARFGAVVRRRITTLPLLIG